MVEAAFGESEGKDGKGVFPASVEFTTDLHSMGQYIQEGKRDLFETVVRFTIPQSSCLLDPAPEDPSGLGYLRGQDLRFVNEQARQGTVLAHVAGGVPNLLLTVPERTPTGPASWSTSLSMPAACPAISPGKPL